MNRTFGASYLASLSEVHTLGGEEMVAAALVDRALEIALEAKAIGIQAQVRLQRARARLSISTGRAEELDRARGEIELAESLARERGLQNFFAEAQVLRAELAAHAGDENERTRAREEAVRIYLKCGNQLQADRAKAMG